MATAFVCVAGLATLWLVTVALVLWAYRRELARLWREPVLRRPILIVESDDWGAGPLAQAEALGRIAEVLARHCDTTGRPAVMSLALVLAVPDGAAIRADGNYRSVELDDARFAPVLDALRGGAASGVFALQLHGLEHYWPPALMASADPGVQAWLRGPVPATTEQLPSHLQSRWVDATVLPSSALSPDAVNAAVAAEVQAYSRIVGNPPSIVVPPTFVWSCEVEAAWAAAGICGVVTPGWRYTLRDARGIPGGDEGPIANGERAGGVSYLVRTDYFEPLRGRGAHHALSVFERVTAQARPCVLENHRDNFIQAPEACTASVGELDALLAGALVRHPDVRFMSTRELEHILRVRDPDWIHSGWRDRLPFVWERLRHSGRLWKLLRLWGLAAVGAGLLRLVVPREAGPRASPAS